MNILIIGGSRFIGPLLIEELLLKKHNITVFNRGRIRQDYGDRVKFVKGDRNDGFNIDERFDTVIDLCAYSLTHVEKVYSDLFFDHYVHIGTAASYKKTDTFPLTEDVSKIGPWPLWGDYNKGKVECENFLSKKENVTILRPVYILGKKNSVERESFIYSSLKNQKPLVLPGDGNAVIQFVFVQDVVRIIGIVAQRKVFGAFNCSGDETITLNELVESMGKISGQKPIIEHNPAADGENFKENEFPFANENFFCSNGKIKNLGVSFTPLLEGLEDDFINHYNDSI